MIDVLSKSLIIEDILCVFDTTHKLGVYDLTEMGRRSDCLVYVTAGKIEYIFQDKLFVAEKDDVAYLPKGSKYMMTVLEPDKFIFVDFNFAYEGDRMPFKQHCPNVNNLFDKLFIEFNRGGLVYCAKAMSVLYDIYAKLILINNGKTYIRSEQRKNVIGVADYMMANYCDPNLVIADQIKRTGMSETNFRYLFKKYFLVSPKQYLLNIRIDYAKELLKGSDDSIEDIAFKAGFNDSAYFGKVFKYKIGTTPGNYRKTQLNNFIGRNHK